MEIRPAEEPGRDGRMPEAPIAGAAGLCPSRDVARKFIPPATRKPRSDQKFPIELLPSAKAQALALAGHHFGVAEIDTLARPKVFTSWPNEGVHWPISAIAL
jgi:hypothetical protein